MMRMQKNNTKSHTLRTGRGFSVIELLVTATILTIVTGFGLMGITRARAAVRLSSAAREYASYIEKARVLSIRSHADDAGERASVTINADRTSYDVTMDLDGDGDMDTRTIPLPDGVTFETVETIAFDWRGRTWNTVGDVTSPNAQVSIRLQGSDDSISIDITGSGDITIDSRVFDDSVPNVNLHVADLAAGPTPAPTPVSVATPTPPVAVATPDPTANPNPTPTPDAGGVIPVPTPTPAGHGNPHATPTPTPAATPTATPTPAPVVCTISADKSLLNLSLDGTSTIKVSHNLGTSVSISGSSSKSSDLQVTPGGAQTVSAGGLATFTIKSKKGIGIYSVTFTSSCGTKVVPVIVASLLTL
jgi:Tfp pilus assembly protein FimT